MTLIGVVACGGKSTRMGNDKSLLEYHGMPQWSYIYKLMQPFCEEVVVSCSKSQIGFYPSTVKCIADKEEYFNIGPMACLLSTHDDYPIHDFLLIGCDYPFLDLQHVKQLFERRNENNMALSFFNRTNNIYEPLLAIYKNECMELIKNRFQNQEYSLRHLLEDISAMKVDPDSEKIIQSVDDKQAFHMALNDLNSH